MVVPNLRCDQCGMHFSERESDGQIRQQCPLCNVPLYYESVPAPPLPPLTPPSDNAKEYAGKLKLAMWLIAGPIVVSLVQIPLLFRQSDTAWGLGGLIGWIVGCIVSIAVGVAMLIRGKP